MRALLRFALFRRPAAPAPGTFDASIKRWGYVHAKR